MRPVRRTMAHCVYERVCMTCLRLTRRCRGRVDVGSCPMAQSVHRAEMRRALRVCVERCVAYDCPLDHGHVCSCYRSHGRVRDAPWRTGTPAYSGERLCSETVRVWRVRVCRVLVWALGLVAVVRRSSTSNFRARHTTGRTGATSNEARPRAVPAATAL
jgi:hypothetical protein